MICKRVITSILIVLFFHSAKAQHVLDVPGKLFVDSFTSEDYAPGTYQNFAIAQDQNSFIYAANTSGVLEFDGVSWRLIRLPDLNVVRKVIVDENNTKWVGADQEMGYLKADSLGFLRFQSLKDKIPKGFSLEGSVWDIFETPEGILFNAGKTLYLWTGKQFNIIEPPEFLDIGFKVRDRFFFQSFEPSSSSIGHGGLYELSGDNLLPIDQGVSLDGQNIYAMLPFGEQILIGTREKGLFLYDETSITKLENEIDPYLMLHQLYSGSQLSASAYAFSTLAGGVVFMDDQGRHLRTLTKGSGLLSNQVYCMALDDRMGLWLGQSVGISRTEPFSPYTLFDEDMGLEGKVSKVIRHKDRLFVTTLQGLYVLDKDRYKEFPNFRSVDGIEGIPFSLLSHRGDLIVASDGIFQVSENGSTRINDLSGRTLYRSMIDTNRVFIGHTEGLSSIYWKDEQWWNEGKIDKIGEEVWSIAEKDDRTLWLGTKLDGAIRIRFPESSQGIKIHTVTAEVTRYGEAQGLYRGWTYVYALEDGIWVRMNPDVNPPLFKYDPSEDRFYEDKQFGKTFGIDSTHVFPIVHQREADHMLLASKKNEQGGVYLFSVSRNTPEDSYSAKRIYYERFDLYWDAFWDNEDVLWAGMEKNGLVRYDTKIEPVIRKDDDTFVRRVVIGQDSTIFGGTKMPSRQWSLPYEDNTIRFEYATPIFEDLSENRYQSQLVGFDEEWSPWTKETRRDYTNVPEGDYQFRVRVKNVYGQVGQVGTFDFEVFPPWYRTVWAYFCYIILLMLLILVSVSLWSRKLKNDKRRLQMVIHDKTEEIREQAEQLKVLDKAKSHFFANISHEFRTPLTLILGPLEKTLKEGRWGELWEADVMHRNAKRLHRLIDQLLDLSKIESGNLKLKVTQGDVILFLKPLLSSFSSHAEQKGVGYDVLFSPDSCEGYFDADKLEKIIYNLVSNAIKFTPDGGQVCIEVKADLGTLKIAVSDTGQGIGQEDLPLIFERFHRTTKAGRQQQEGTGIGLALTKELAILHRGDLFVESILGKGSTFVATLPLKRSAYKEKEIGTAPNQKLTSTPLKDKRYDGKTHENEVKVKEDEDKPLLLFVDDNKDLRAYVSRTLQLDFTIVTAVDGEEGIRIAVEQVPDIIVSDLVMPKKDGIELCAALKADERTDHIPIVLLTAKATVESRLQGLRTGADDYLTKPFNAEELLVRVQNLHKQRKLLREHYSRNVVLKPRDIDIDSKDEQFLKKVMKALERHMDDSNFSMDDFGYELGMSRMQLHRKLKALTGYSTTEFIRIQRLRRAADLLSSGGGNVSEIAYEVGFSNLSYFAKRFKEQYGMSPSEYLERQL